MREKQVEEYLKKQVAVRLGGIAYKFVSPARRSVPDRLCVVPKYSFFVECKATGEKATPAQLREHARLEALDQWVYVVGSKYAIDKIIDFWEDKLREEGLL